MYLPKLPETLKGETYMRFLESAKRKDSRGVRSDFTWFFQSIQELSEDDLVVVAGNSVMFNNPAPYYLKDKDSAIDSFIEAMGRGATVAINTGLSFIGASDFFDCQGTSGGRRIGYVPCDDGGEELCKCSDCAPSDNRACDYTCCQVKKLMNSKYGDNFVNLVATNPFGDTTPTSHIKMVAFFYKKKKRFSIFLGGWNPIIGTNPLKETGYGLVGNLNEDIGIYLSHFVYRYLDMMRYVTDEEHYTEYQKVQQKLLGIVPEISDPSNVPAAPVNMPTVISYGPNHCDKNLGCGIPDKNGRGGRVSRYSKTCPNATEYVTAVDHDVKLSLGVSPSITHFDQRCVGQGFEQNGWGGPDDKSLIDSTKNIVDFINSSERYMKFSLMTQSMGAPIAPNDDYYMCGYMYGARIVKLIADAMIAKARQVPVLGMTTNEGDFGANGMDGCQTGNQNLAWKLICDEEAGKNFYIKSYVEGGMHDKIWVNDKGFILATGHIDTAYHMTVGYNYTARFENCPNLTNYMNNVWNYYWNNSSEWENDILAQKMGENEYGKNLGDISCPNQNSLGCCIDPANTVVKPRRGFGEPDIHALFPTPPPEPSPPPGPAPKPTPTQLSWLKIINVLIVITVALIALVIALVFFKYLKPRLGTA